MNKLQVIGLSVVTGVMVAGLVSGTALAWHPEGHIKKLVQNQTSNSGAPSDANDLANAVSAKPGDVLKYVIEISNTGKPDSKGYNDMVGTVMTDTLPAGVELVSDPAQREIKVQVGRVKPGETVTKEYLVKVTAQQNGAIENKACFEGDTEVKDNKQKGCDVAVVRVTVPQILTTTTPPPAPELPHTGPANLLGLFAGASGLGYGLHRVASRKRR